MTTMLVAGVLCADIEKEELELMRASVDFAHYGES
jgi:hypothetical protein